MRAGLRDRFFPGVGTAETCRGAASAAPRGLYGCSLVLVALLVRAQETLGLLLGTLDLAVELAAGLVLGDLLGLVQPLVHHVTVLAGEILRLVHPIRHGLSFPAGCPTWLRPL